MPQYEAATIPAYADTVIVGGGTSGAIIAGRLAERSGRSILLLEAGPDYGPLAEGRWPPALLDARCIPWNVVDWNYLSAARYGAAGLRLERARAIGGCSTHNGCAAIWGSRVDYDTWESAGNPGWGTESLLPYFRASTRRLCVRKPAPDEITPWHQAVLDSAPGAGIPLVDDLNDLDQDVGMAASPVNVSEGRRWNTALAYLDPVHAAPTLCVRGNVLVDRVICRGGRAVGLEVLGPGGPTRIEAGQIVLCGGAYGSPAILLRSGIGPPDELSALGIAPVHDLTGVGRNLHDHPAVVLRYGGSGDIVDRMRRFEAAGGWLCEEQTIAKLRSSRCSTAFDLHLYPVGSPYWPNDGTWSFTIPVAAMTPRSRGTLRLSGVDPEARPLIDHGYVTDPEGHDLAVLRDGIVAARALAAQPALAAAAGPEIEPGPDLVDSAELRDYIRASCGHYYHPVGTCKMGPASDPEAVVDACGRMHGIAGLLVADAAIMPVIPRANTNIPCAVIGEKIAALLLDEEGHGAGR